jgi:Cys-tRNA(Pro)/Cys-tRNA(Cys) deacylase
MFYSISMSEKTNVMRLLDSKGIFYIEHSYDPEITDGEQVAKILNESPEQTFKTLVTQGNNHEYFVFVVPVNKTLNLKKAAKSVGVKSIEMIKQKELLPLTGYIHGGCSPLGMKKLFVTIIDETALIFDSIIFSAGKKGFQVQMNPLDIDKVITLSFFDIID